MLWPSPLKRTTELVLVDYVDQIPTVEMIKGISRQQTLKLVFFDKRLQEQRNAIGQNLRNELPGFRIAVHTARPEIDIVKLITDKEIEDNQLFFEQCAKHYRQLAKDLIFKLADKLDLAINEDFPLITFNQLKRGKLQKGEMENWNYFVHGFHCGFENIESKQVVEVPLVFGLEFGDLDPYFFTRFIKTTPQYHPLPIAIFDDHEEGVIINEKMIAIGKFERIPSNFENHFGIVVTDREKIEIKSFSDRTGFQEGKP